MPQTPAHRQAGRRLVAHLPSAAALQVVLGLTALVSALVLGLLALTTEPSAAPAGVPVTGPLTDRVLATSRGVADVALCAVVGELLWAGWALRPSGTEVASRLLSAVRWSAGAWAAATLVWAWATAADVIGVPLSEVTTSELTVLWQLPQGRSLAVLVLTALAVVALAGRVRTAGHSHALLVLALAGTAPLLLTGHAATSSNHYVTGQALLLHVIAAVLWSGGLLAALAHLSREHALLAALLPRYSRLALVCFVVTALSGLAGAWTRLGLDPELWASTYGALLLAKVGCLVLLGTCGALHRAAALRWLVEGRPRAFLRLAVGEVLVMGAAIALAVVLARTAPPAGALSRADPPHASAFPTVDRSLSPFSWRTLLTESREDVLLTTAVLAVVVAYLAAARATRARSGPAAWPAARVLAFLVGAGLTFWAVCGGLGAYATALLSAHVLQLVVLLVLAPPLLLVGLEPSPVTGSRAGRRLRDTGVADGVLAAIVVLTAVYATPLLSLALNSPLLHATTVLGTLAAGSVLAAAVVRVYRERRYGDLLLALGVPGLLLLVHGLRLRPGRGLVADGWFERLDWWWADAAADQRLASGLAVASGAVLLTVALGSVLLARGYRSS